MNTPLLLSLLLSLTTSAFAGQDGGNSSGGGGAITRPDDSVVLADPFVIRHESEGTGELSDEIIAELQRAGWILVQYGAEYSFMAKLSFFDDNSALIFPQANRIRPHSYTAAFINNHVLRGTIEYRFVADLPDYNTCHQHRMVALPEGASEQLVACTVGPITWIKESLFRRMSVREQALTVIHERLHTLSPGLPEEIIADITTSLGTALELYNAQARGERPMLTDLQVNRLQRLMMRIMQAELHRGRGYMAEMEASRAEHQDTTLDELQILNTYTVAREGGGLLITPYHDLTEQMPEGAYVGIGAVVHPYSLSRNATIVGSTCKDVAAEVRELSTPFRNISIMTCILEEGASLINSEISLDSENAGMVTGLENAMDIDVESRLMSNNGGNIHIGIGASIINSYVGLSSSSPYATNEREELHMGAGARIENSSLHNFNALRLGPGSRIIDSDVRVAAPLRGTTSRSVWRLLALTLEPRASLLHAHRTVTVSEATPWQIKLGLTLRSIDDPRTSDGRLNGITIAENSVVDFQAPGVDLACLEHTDWDTPYVREPRTIRAVSDLCR